MSKSLSIFSEFKKHLKLKDKKALGVSSTESNNQNTAESENTNNNVVMNESPIIHFFKILRTLIELNPLFFPRLNTVLILEYDFIMTLKEKYYPRFLCRLFYDKTGRKLNLRKPKTFNEKIQWLKLYDNSKIKSELTDKVLVRDWVKEKIGEEYLKPALWIGNNFDDIPFDTLPDAFIIKANNGCKWHYKIKNKQQFLENKDIYNYIKMRFDWWMRQSFFGYSDFELQYKDISPKLIIEPLLIDKDKSDPSEYEIYCFNGIPKIFQKITYSQPPVCSVYKENFEQSEIKFNPDYVYSFEEADTLLKQAVSLSQKLSEEFKLVRVDWLIYNDKIYFNEMTFTPFSGYYIFENENWNKQLGDMLKI